MRHSSSPRSRNDEWPQYANQNMDQNMSTQPITGHLPINGFDDPYGMNSSSLLMVGSGLHDMNFNSPLSQYAEKLSTELDQMPSEPSCPELLSRNSMNPQFLDCFPMQLDPASGGYNRSDLSMPLPNTQNTNLFEATISGPLQLNQDAQAIPEIQLPATQYSYPSSFSSGQDHSYPGTPRTPSVNSPRSDIDSFSQMLDDCQSTFSHRSPGPGSNYSPSMDGYDDEKSAGAPDTELHPYLYERPSNQFLTERPSNQFLTPETLVPTHSYSLGRQSQPVSPLFTGEMARRRPSDIATNYYIPPGPFGSDATRSPLPSPAVPDRPRSSSESGPTRPNRQSLKRRRTPEKLEVKEDQPANDSIIGPDIDDAPLKPRRPRGKRNGPLSPTKKEQLNAARAAGNTCLNCCISKVKCDGEWPCERCAQGLGTRHVNMCTRAHFKDLIKRRSTISSTLPSLRRPVRKSMGLTGDLEELGISHEDFTKIREMSVDWDLVVSYRHSELHTIDLSELCRSLLNLQKHRFSPVPFEMVFETHYSRASSAEKDLFKKGALPSSLSDLVKWTNVFKFTTVDQISKDGSRMWKIPPNGQYEVILSQVVLIELRRFERNIYEVLSKTLHNKKGEDPNAVPELVTSLGCLLLSLRWQVCLWKRYRSFLDRDDHQEKRGGRFGMIEDICKRLYPYFFLCGERCLEDATTDQPKGADMHYANMSGTIHEFFPVEQSEEGFEEWLREGDVTVRNCQVDEQSLIHTIL